MKYEQLNRIPAKRTIWPENTVVDFEAYDAKDADEAFKEIMAWYTESKTKLEELSQQYTELQKESAKVYEIKTKEASEMALLSEKTRVINESLEWKNKELEAQLAEAKKDLDVAKTTIISTQTDFNAMTNRINTNTEQYNELQTEYNKLLDENKELTATLKGMKDSYAALDVQYNTTLNQLAEIEKTMGSITDLVSFYKEWKKNSK